MNGRKARCVPARCICSVNYSAPKLVRTSACIVLYGRSKTIVAVHVLIVTNNEPCFTFFYNASSTESHSGLWVFPCNKFLTLCQLVTSNKLRQINSKECKSWCKNVHRVHMQLMFSTWYFLFSCGYVSMIFHAFCATWFVGGVLVLKVVMNAAIV